ncbi:MAG: MarR family transcriptional regulator [Phycisphaerales bacterium]|nr:MarR family transcriptional regulator [Phycisphaerales bacterium]MCB9857296.1 MarR family transcriptional regulator [Phycisphaerales bacterium]MCB9862990.1 MarR family transcriptional regulator [Phycisphaerales bacterium]
MNRTSTLSTEETADRLHSAAIHLLRSLRHEDEKSGLSAPRLSALSVVVFAGPLRLGALANAERVRAPTMTRLVQELEKENLVRREPDPADGRAFRIAATPKGRRLLLQGRKRRIGALVKRIDALSNADHARLRNGLDVLAQITQ